MEAKGGPAFNLSDIQSGAKDLRTVEEPAKKAEGKNDEDDTTLQVYIDLYEKYNGDLVKIFDELSENPGKAIKYPPKNAQDFAQKYYQGAFTYADERRAEAK
mmetsp:Transcript_48703/g.62512  ORF Transcript_48703/g.62512 Transcript_48703/m.62512 type:complete len:102 (+) Transcript_48703:60-365(+)